MRDTLASRTRPARALWLALPLAAALASACKPELPPGGYETVSYRPPRVMPGWSHPDPPPVTPGSTLGGGGPKIVARNLPAGVTQAMVDQGQELFGQVCTACHSAGGAGSTAAPALNDKQWLHISGAYPEIVSIINAGVANPKQYPGVMPPRGGGNFTPEQVGQIAAYVFALSQQGES
ncbi:MAG TPA: cytochrome c [Longimicrobium sp.]|jgi:mono/diheme cytochrome c family protein